MNTAHFEDNKQNFIFPDLRAFSKCPRMLYQTSRVLSEMYGIDNLVYALLFFVSLMDCKLSWLDRPKKAFINL